MTCSRPQRNVHRHGIEPGTSWSEIRRPIHCATPPPLFLFCFFSHFLSLTASTIRQLLLLGIKITKGSRYFVLCIEIQSFLVFRLIMLALKQFLTPRMKLLFSKTCLQGIYYISHNLLFELPKIATFIAHKNKLLK